jgi:isopentenyl diphosphate isomerase/L-lactate dehydrogenase-like FMN-dependent dehydrogenase
MALTDDEFREEYKPLYIPAHFEVQDTQQNKIVFALAQLGEGSAADVITELETLQPGITDDQLKAITKTILADLYDKGLLKGEEHNGQMQYNLSKITEANDGSTDTGESLTGLS